MKEVPGPLRHSGLPDGHASREDGCLDSRPEGCLRRMTCLKATEAIPEKMEPSPEMMQSAEEHQEVPKEKVIVRSL
jgi:hypothetical protein